MKMVRHNDSPEKSDSCADLGGRSNQQTPSRQTPITQVLPYIFKSEGDAVKSEVFSSSHSDKENTSLYDLDGHKCGISNPDVQCSEPRIFQSTHSSSKISKKRSFAKNVAMVSSSLLQQFNTVYDLGEFFFVCSIKIL